MMLLPRCLFAIEKMLKGRMFDCRQCGQCLLAQTALICPMTCPKGLRNGPCGGSLDGKCEVRADQDCIWVRIRNRLHQTGGIPAERIHAPLQASLLGTSSLLNRFNGSDRRTRLPLPRLKLTPGACGPSSQQTESRLARALKSGRMVLTTEVRSPRTLQNLSKTKREIAALAPLADALNTTSSHAGRKTMDSMDVAKQVLPHRCEAIPQICGRDVTPDSFLKQLVRISRAGIHNVLCLTGDWLVQEARDGADRHRRFFRMDAAQMIYEARHLREKSRSAFSELEADPPHLFIGAAINPATAPRGVVLSRLSQKIACGVDFIQTQAVCDGRAFCRWLRSVEAWGLSGRVAILASIPLIGSLSGLEILHGLPGVRLPEKAHARIAGAGDIRSAGITFSRGLVEEILSHGKVDGFHFMNFGVSAETMAEELEHARGILRGASHRPTAGVLQGN